MNPAVAPLSYSPQQVISQAFGFDPTELFAEQDRGQVQLNVNGAVLHIKIYQQEGSNVLLLMADLGPLPGRDRSAYYQMMLVANSGWRDLAGGALCTDESGNRALLRLRLDLNTLGAQALSPWLAAFVAAAEAWAERIAPTPSGNDIAHAGAGAVRPQEVPGLFPFDRA